MFQKKEKNMKRTKKIVTWYEKNINKLVIFFIIIVLVSLIFVYVPYTNVFIPTTVSFGIVFLLGYWFFSPSTTLLVALSLAILVISLTFSVLRVPVLAESISDVLYVFLIFIFLNCVKDLRKKP